VKIKREMLARMSIEEFAEENDLTMKVVERKHYDHKGQRFYAVFDGAEVKGDSVLMGLYGDGETEEEAIRSYAQVISGKTIVFNAEKKYRLELDVPILKGAR